MAGKVAGNDLQADCTTLFNKYSCQILLSAGTLLLAGCFWFASRIETKTESMQQSLIQIEVSVARIQGALPSSPASPSNVAARPRQP